MTEGINKSDLVTTRDYRDSDYNFILATWLRGLFHGNPQYSIIPIKIFMSNYHTVIDALLESKRAVVKVSCLKEDPEVILAYVVTSPEGDRIHWAFCKSAWRGIGLTKSLIPPNAKTITSVTKIGLSWLRSHPDMIYNPFAII